MTTVILWGWKQRRSLRDAMRMAYSIFLCLWVALLGVPEYLADEIHWVLCSTGLHGSSPRRFHGSRGVRFGVLDICTHVQGNWPRVRGGHVETQGVRVYHLGAGVGTWVVARGVFPL